MARKIGVSQARPNTRNHASALLMRAKRRARRASISGEFMSIAVMSDVQLLLIEKEAPTPQNRGMSGSV
jgi:hypothetical protein